MVTLEKLFELQDEVFQEHLNSSEILKKTFSFLSECVRLNTRILTSMKFESNKQTAIRNLAVDSLSHTIVAIRLGLWGDLPESFSMLRSAIESSAQLQYVVKHSKYETLIYELNRKFEHISFDNCVAGLEDLGKRIRRIHGRISETASHSTARRMAVRSYQHEGEFYDRVGFAWNVKNAELALFYCMDTCMMLLEAFLWAFEQDNLTFEWKDTVYKLSERFKDIQKELLQKSGISETNE